MWSSIPGWCRYGEFWDRQVDRAPGDRESVFVELGVWQGQGVARLCERVIASGKPIVVVGVDHFLGSVEHAGLPELKDLEARCRRYLQPYQDVLGNRLRVLRMDSAEAAVLFPDGGVRVVMVDGSHEMGDVARDIQAWLPKLEPDGIMGGDDWIWRGVKEAAWACLPEGKRLAVIVGDQPYWEYQ